MGKPTSEIVEVGCVSLPKWIWDKMREKKEAEGVAVSQQVTRILKEAMQDG